MYPLARFAKVTIGSTFGQKLAIADTSVIHFRCRPWDLDMFMEANNGRIITLYDLGRFDLVGRTGFTGLLLRKKWGLVIAGSTCHYRRRIRLWEKVRIETRLAGIDERWLYLEQSMWVGDAPCSSLFLRTAVTGRGGLVPTDEVSQALDISLADIDQLSAWAHNWIANEDQRPWPPEHAQRD